jgi:hypothetical protein
MLSAPSRADCPQTAPSPPTDPLSDRPYAVEPARPCKDLSQDIVEPSPHPLRKVGFGGLGAGAALLGLGGLLWLGGALTNDPGSRRFELNTALVFGISGGVLFAAGATLVIAASPLAPATAGRPPGAELVFAGTF